MGILAFMLEDWTKIGTTVAGMMMVVTMFRQLFFRQFESYVEGLIGKLMEKVDPYVRISFHQFSGGRYGNKAYKAIERYLAAECTSHAYWLKANVDRDILSPVFSIETGHEVTDEFKGVKVWWVCEKEQDNNNSSSHSRYLRLKFPKQHRKLITEAYLKHVMEGGQAMINRNRQLKLYNYRGGEMSCYRPYWTEVTNFEHPVTFDTLAMEKKRKEEIIKDLMDFSKAKDYYWGIGKAWKRGYLLYGPPGTGKSSMIAAMANLLKYDVYDLELTAVKSNNELKMLLVTTPSKSIVVIEDIDCLSSVTGDRGGAKKGGKKEKHQKKITLSGLLNAVDGLYSASEGEHIMVFTTNYVERLDDALIRRGRMDKHIEMSFCGYEAFQMLAKNYLGIDRHALFPEIGRLLNETHITPADVSEILNTKSNHEQGDDDKETKIHACLQTLLQVLQEKARVLTTTNNEEHQEENTNESVEVKIMV